MPPGAQEVQAHSVSSGVTLPLQHKARTVIAVQRRHNGLRRFTDVQRRHNGLRRFIDVRRLLQTDRSRQAQVVPHDRSIELRLQIQVHLERSIEPLLQIQVHLARDQA